MTRPRPVFHSPLKSGPKVYALRNDNVIVEIGAEKGTVTNNIPTRWRVSSFTVPPGSVSRPPKFLDVGLCEDPAASVAWASGYLPNFTSHLRLSSESWG